MKRSFIREILESINEETISFAGGLPDDTLFPVRELAEAGIKVFERPDCLQYSAGGGIKPLREKIADLYNSKGIQTDASNILITTGSQQGLYVIARYFRGREIVIEEPSYLGAANIFKLNDMAMTSVPLGYEGIDTGMFRKRFKDSKLAYLIPDFHNPMSSFYSRSTRESVASAVLDAGGLLIEDAPYSELYFEKREDPILSLMPEQTLQLGSFSKTLAPGLRIGWIRAEKYLIMKLTAIKEAIDLHSSSLSQHIINEYLSDGKRFQTHLETLRMSYKAKMVSFADALTHALPQFQFIRPKGGMFIYGSLPGVDTYMLIEKTMARGVVFVPGDQFYQDGRRTSEIRFNFTHASSDKAMKGLSIIHDEYLKLL